MIRFLIISSLCVAALLTCAQGKRPISLGTRETIQSVRLKESRDLLIYHPETNPLPLPLILVFDGESLFGTVVSTVRFMNYSLELPLMPEAVVVGIPNTNRNRDMPIPQTYGGESEKNFSYFITEELIPKLKTEYPLNGQIVLIGHSQGGLFVSYLMSQHPQLFSMVVALDAPINVDDKVTLVRQQLVKSLSNNPQLKYFSGESAYGWGQDWGPLSHLVNTQRKEYPDETHESMPVKSIYDGLKFLFRDFPPAKRDMSLVPLLHFYADLSDRSGFQYEPPLQVLLGSAHRKVINTRKAEALELLSFAEDRYGDSDQLKRLKQQASVLKETLDPLVEFYLNHPKPSAQEIKPYLGRWVGELVVRDGRNLPMDFVISIEGGKGKMLSVQPWPPYEKVEPDILFVDQKGQLIFGRKNKGSGLVISTAHLDGKDNLAGKDELVGFTISDDMPEEVKKGMKFVIENPNTFLVKKK